LRSEKVCIWRTKVTPIDGVCTAAPRKRLELAHKGTQLTVFVQPRSEKYFGVGEQSNLCSENLEQKQLQLTYLRMRAASSLIPISCLPIPKFLLHEMLFFGKPKIFRCAAEQIQFICVVFDANREIIFELLLFANSEIFLAARLDRFSQLELISFANCKIVHCARTKMQPI
jgi:hypothetical protein